MNDVGIRVEGLGKQYRIGTRERYSTLRDTVTNAASAPFRWMRSLTGPSQAAQTESPSDLIWALKDVSFDIPQGSVVGVIGRNGAGKSTLLKVLSRITEPTEGRVEIRGRVGSLLEVGTGFHPELTGRDNIYLNGAILGMRKADVARNFDQIVAFSEVEKFIDTPVKHFSSGMYMRLAFAVAAHLEPEILIVDEVLAVGDSSFQKKCLGKMGDVAETGRTVVFVSHQMNQIRRLCGRCVWLDRGRCREIGKTADVVSAYEAVVSTSPNRLHRVDDGTDALARFVSWEIKRPEGNDPNHLRSMGPVTIRFVVKVNRTISHAHHGVALFGSDGQLMWGTATNGLVFGPGVHDLTYELPTLPLRPGNYLWRVSLYCDGQPLDIWDSSPELVVATEPVTHSRDEWSGILNIPYTFSTSCLH